MPLTDIQTEDHSRLSRLPGIIGIVVVCLSILAGLTTYTILTGLSPIKPTPDIITWLLGGNLALVLIMVGMILWQVWSLIAARRRGTAGAGLHIRLVSLFSLIAALPGTASWAWAASPALLVYGALNWDLLGILPLLAGLWLWAGGREKAAT